MTVESLINREGSSEGFVSDFWALNPPSLMENPAYWFEPWWAMPTIHHNVSKLHQLKKFVAHPTAQADFCFWIVFHQGSW